MSKFPQLSTSGFRLYITKIADSKKEIQISFIDNSITNYQQAVFNIFHPVNWENGQFSTVTIPVLFTHLNALCKNVIEDASTDLVIDAGEGKYIPIVNHLFVQDQQYDVSDPLRYHMVLKTNEALPNKFKRLTDINLSIIKSEFLNQEVFYAGKRPPIIKDFGESLDVDYSITLPHRNNQLTNEDFENFNELTGSVGEERLISMLSSSYQERLVDYSSFQNFVHFSSAERRLVNFKTKLEKIESLQTEISKSLYSPGQVNPEMSSSFPSTHGAATQIRIQNFNELNSILNGFTDYEKYLYSDNQVNATGSAPGLGKNYIDWDPFVRTENVIKEVDYEGFPVAFFISASTGQEIAFTAEKYKVQDAPFHNSSGSFYLSFLLRASSSFEEKFSIHNSQTSSLESPYPTDSMYTAGTLLPETTGSEYRRFVFESSASYWLPLNTSAANNSIGHPVLGVTDLSKGSSQIEIIPQGGEITGSLIQVFADYTGLVTSPINSGEFITGSFVPRGDLFNVSLNGNTDSSAAVITDIKITETNPLNALPFSNLYSVSSSVFTNWYNGMISSASFYDSQNIHRLYNNIPSVFQNMEETSNSDMIRYVDMMGEFYDEYKVLVDDYYKIFNLGYSDYEELPPKFNDLLAQNLGFNILSEESGSILAKFGLFDTGVSERKEYNNKLYNNILNNLSYLYKTKGTENSIKALLNCYGLPSNVLKIKETGQNLKSYDQSFLSNDTNLTAVGKLSDLTGSVSYEKNIVTFRSLMVDPSMAISASWNTSPIGETPVVSQSAVEGVFKMNATENTMSLFSSRAAGHRASVHNKEQWRLIVIPSSSLAPKVAKVKFELNNTANAASAIATNNVSAETAWLDILDNKLTNILLQKSSSGHDINATHTYELVVGRLTGEELTFITSSKLTSDGSSDSDPNKNYMSGSAKGFFIAPDYTGSIAEIRTWSKPLAIGTFKQHIYNPQSTVGNDYSASQKDLLTHLTLGENYKSGSSTFLIKDTAIDSNNDMSFNIDTEIFAISSSVFYDSTIIETFNFPIYGSGAGTLQYNDNSILIPDTFTLKDDLRWDQSVIKQNHDLLGRDIINTNQLDFSRSPQNVVNDFLKDNLGNLDFNDLFADPRDEFKETYPDLDKFNDALMNDFNVSIDVNKFMRSVSRIFNSSLLESVKQFIPARARLLSGLVLKPTYTERIKMPTLRERPSVKKENDNAGTLTDTTAFDVGEMFLPSEYTFEHPDVNFEQTTYPADSNTGENFVDVRNIPERDFNKRPELTWGTSSNDTHFTSYVQGGIYDDGNTAYNENQDVFHMIGDVEFLSGSFLNGRDAYFDYTKDSTFLNKKIVQTSEAVSEREMGATLQYVSTDSSSFGKLLDTGLRRPQNHHTTFGGHSHMNLGRIYEGYQYRGDDDGFTYTDSSGNSKGISNETQLAHLKLTNKTGNSKLAYEDLTTRAFYRVEIDRKGKGKLKVIRTDDAEGQTQ